MCLLVCAAFLTLATHFDWILTPKSPFLKLYDLIQIVKRLKLFWKLSFPCFRCKRSEFIHILTFKFGCRLLDEQLWGNNKSHVRSQLPFTLLSCHDRDFAVNFQHPAPTTRIFFYTAAVQMQLEETRAQRLHSLVSNIPTYFFASTNKRPPALTACRVIGICSAPTLDPNQNVYHPPQSWRWLSHRRNGEAEAESARFSWRSNMFLAHCHVIL